MFVSGPLPDDFFCQSESAGTFILFEQLMCNAKYDFNTICFRFILFYFYLDQATYINIFSLLQICYSNNNVNIISHVIYQIYEINYSRQCTISIYPENVRKPKLFWRFQEV